MKNEKKDKTKKKGDDEQIDKNGKKPGDQFAYPPSEDIYSNAIEEEDLDPEDPTKFKTENADPDAPNEKAFRDDVSGDDLDVPGSELDDEEEGNGAEDEENNNYSLGGDDHNDLEENKGE